MYVKQIEIFNNVVVYNQLFVDWIIRWKAFQNLFYILYSLSQYRIFSFSKVADDYKHYICSQCLSFIVSTYILSTSQYGLNEMEAFKILNLIESLKQFSFLFWSFLEAYSVSNSIALVLFSSNLERMLSISLTKTIEIFYW